MNTKMNKSVKKISSVLASLVLTFGIGITSSKADISEETIDEAQIESISSAPQTSTKVSYLYGNDRYQTSVRISKSGWSSGSDTLILVNGNDTILGIAASPLAKLYNAPILVTKQNSIDSSVREEIKRLNPKTVFMIGDTSHISKTLSNTIKSITGATMLRISGKYPGEISANIANYIASKKSVSSAYVVSIENGVADALSSVSARSSDIRPIIVVNKSSIGSTGLKFIDNYVRNVYYIGGVDSISRSLVSKISGYAANGGESNRISGIDRNDTNVRVIKRFYTQTSFPNIVVSTSDNAGLIDTVSAGAYASKINAPVLFVGRNKISSYTKSFAESKTATYIIQIGGSISSSVTSSLQTALSTASTTEQPTQTSNPTSSGSSSSGSLINITGGSSSSNVDTNTDGGNIIGVGLKGKKIVVDAGHGGKDTGASGINGALEKNWTLTTANACAAYLRSKGATVIMTRESDVYPTLPDRVALSNSKGADFFVSIHYNQGGDPLPDGGLSGTGTEVFKGEGASANLAALNVQKSIVSYFNTRDRGVKDGTHLYVIRNTVAPAILVEGGFISNVSDYNAIGSDSKLRAMGNRIALGIEATFQGKRL